MKKNLVILSLSLLIFVAPAKASDAEFDIFATSTIIDNQSVIPLWKGVIELQTIHRFSLIESHRDLFGLYAAANTRMGLAYGVSDRLMVGIGTSKFYQLQDLRWKYALLVQNTDGSMPISLSYYGNVVVDARASDVFGTDHENSDFKFIHRLSYFNQFIVARKFNDNLTLQVAPSFIYFNAVPYYIVGTGEEAVMTKYNNFNIGMHVGGRYRVRHNHAILMEYNTLLTSQDGLSDDLKPKPALTFGYEIGSPTHAFQLFVTNYANVIDQYNLLFNTNDFTKGKYMFGFNIVTRF